MQTGPVLKKSKKKEIRQINPRAQYLILETLSHVQMMFLVIKNACYINFVTRGEVAR